MFFKNVLLYNNKTAKLFAFHVLITLVYAYINVRTTVLPIEQHMFSKWAISFDFIAQNSVNFEL